MGFGDGLGGLVLLFTETDTIATYEHLGKKLP
jgi:hypothetical protein